MGMYQKVKEGVYSMKSLLIHGRFRTEKWDFQHHVVPPLSSSTAYRLDSVERGAKGFAQFASPDPSDDAPVYIYDRLGEPCRDMLEERLAFAEKGDIAITFSSGMAAIAASLGIHVFPGQKMVSQNVIYGCTYSLFTNWYPKYKIDVEFIDLANLDNLPPTITENTRVVYLETPANPSLDIMDIRGIRKIVDSFNQKRRPEDRIRIVVDNTFATPYCQRPLEFGADLVIHSLTKNICGFGTDIGGVVIGRKEFEPPLLMYRKDYGGIMSPKAAWPILVYGLSTLPLRATRQMKNAMEIAQFLEDHPKVERVHYPGLKSFKYHNIAKKQMRDYDGKFAPGIIIYFVLKGTPEEAKTRGIKFIDYIAENAYTLTMAVSLGQIRTLIENPASMTHSAIPAEEQVKAGIDPGGIRLAIGIEDAKDIMNDLSQALDQI